MASLPIFHLRQSICSKGLLCQHMYAEDLKKVGKLETIKLFPKFKNLIVAEAFYSLSPKSIKVTTLTNYTVQITNDGCFDLICKECGVFYRIFTRGSIGILQVAKLSMLKQNNHKNVGKFIPSPLAVFVNIISEDVSNAKSENAFAEIKEISDEEYDDDIYLDDEEEFNYMFSNEIEPFVGGFKSVTPFLLQ